MCSEQVNSGVIGRKGGLLLSNTAGMRRNSSWRQVEQMLLESTTRTQSVVTDPVPFTLLLSLGKYTVNYETDVYVKAGVSR